MIAKVTFFSFSYKKSLNNESQQTQCVELKLIIIALYRCCHLSLELSEAQHLFKFDIKKDSRASAAKAMRMNKKITSSYKECTCIEA
jgi:hypothetical protein